MNTNATSNAVTIPNQKDLRRPIPPTVQCDYRSLGRRADGKYIEHDAIPHLCHIELTYACNEKCIFCYNPERAKVGDLSEIDRIVRSIAASHIPHVYLIGGEPSLL